MRELKVDGVPGGTQNVKGKCCIFVGCHNAINEPR